uniref:Putative tail fiber protein gp53-like C-terminal domain-containing protein n=1 Tax=Pseudomonas phage Touem01 TaxID=3138548 RepID=A0AAU6W263_9VIRU
MANQPEIIRFDAGVYQIEPTDPVDGGAGAVTNAPLLALSNRTSWLKKHVDDIESGAFIPTGLAPINSPDLTGTPTAPTQAAGDNTTKIATDAFVQTAVSGVSTVNVAGAATTTLTQAQWGVATIILVGALTANKAVVFPAQIGRWQVVNATTGNFTITLKTAAGTGVTVTRSTSTNIWFDGTNITLQQTDFISPALTGNPTAPTPTVGDNDTSVATTAFVQSAMAVYGLGTSDLVDLINQDVNTVRATGFYQIGTGAINLPAGITSGVLIVATNAGAFSQQLFMPQGLNKLYQRMSDASGYTSWREIVGADSPSFTGTPTAPTAPQFGTGSRIVNLDTLKARGHDYASIFSVSASIILSAAHAGSVVLIGGPGAATVTLPAASSVPMGTTISLQSNTSVNATNTISRQGNDVIVGLVNGVATTASSFSFLFGDTATVTSDGVSNWIVSANSTANFIAAQFLKAQSFAQNGYQKIPGGLILQWGRNETPASGQVVITLPTAYPNNQLSVSLNPFLGAAYNATAAIQTNSLTKTSFGVFSTQGTSGATTSPPAAALGFTWFSIGY